MYSLIEGKAWYIIFLYVPDHAFKYLYILNNKFYQFISKFVKCSSSFLEQQNITKCFTNTEISKKNKIKVTYCATFLNIAFLGHYCNTVIITTLFEVNQSVDIA